MSQHILPLRTTYLVFAALMGLLVLTVAVGYLDLGMLGLAVALLIASVKAGLILLYFMHVRFSGKLVGLFSTAAFFWLAIMIALTLNDYVTRGWMLVDGK